LRDELIANAPVLRLFRISSGTYLCAEHSNGIRDRLMILRRSFLVSTVLLLAVTTSLTRASIIRDAATVAAADPTTVLRVFLQGTQTVAADRQPTGPAMPGFGWQLDDRSQPWPPMSAATLHMRPR
jgi:hypothetical protein